MATPRDEATEAIRQTINEGMLAARNYTFDAVIDIIENEIELSGDGVQCLKRVRALKERMNRPGEAQ